ncbi:MAG: RHS repeat domain-containing protein [Gammaproteobacteria bacterium]|nr:RHS repeat protein [Pseudomonadales bacterium]MCP5349093.1 RHS repeat protein [Pseudomonadales bacterium]
MKKLYLHTTGILATLVLGLLFSLTVTGETYSYDAVGRLIGVVYDDGSSISYSFAANGNLLEIVSAASTQVPNLAPVVSVAGGNRVIADADDTTGEIVSFYATATDSDGTVDTTEWLIDNQLVATGQTADIALPDGVSAVVFKATDDDGDSTSEMVAVTVLPPNAPPEIVTLSSDGNTTSAVIRGGITSDGGVSFTPDFKVGDSIRIYAILEPEPEDIGSNSEIFVVAAAGSSFLLITPDGLVPWDGSVGNLIAFDEVVLSARHTINILELFGSELTLTSELIGNYVFFIGYTTSAGNIVYNQEAIQLNITE